MTDLRVEERENRNDFTVGHKVVQYACKTGITETKDFPLGQQPTDKPQRIITEFNTCIPAIFPLILAPTFDEPTTQTDANTASNVATVSVYLTYKITCSEQIAVTKTHIFGRIAWNRELGVKTALFHFSNFCHRRIPDSGRYFVFILPWL